MMQARSLAALECEDTAPRLMAAVGEGRGGKSPHAHPRLPRLGYEHGAPTCNPPLQEGPSPQTRVPCRVVEPHAPTQASSEQAAPTLLQSSSESLQGQRFLALSRPLFQYLSTLTVAS